MDNLELDVKFTNESATEPVTLTEAKRWLRVDVPDDDQIILELITTSRQQCEGYLNISLIPRTVSAWLYIGLGEIRLPYGPVKTFTSLTNPNGDPIQGYELKYDVFQALDPCPEVKAVYDAGFNGDIPKQFKTAILSQLAWNYQHRGDEVGDDLSPQTIRILKPYRRVT